MLARIAGAALLAVMGVPEAASAQGRQPAPQLDTEAYEGWRQYSAHCARCHGQDVLGNPVAADLLASAGNGGPMADQAAFVGVVKAGRVNRGMPGFASTLTDAHVNAIYAYVKGRADDKIPAGRPTRAGK
jgi:mono/diheme cytochrome c family protein